MLEPQSQTPDLRKLCRRLCPVGTIATSSKGFEFKLVSRDPLTKKESWLDLKSGITWHDKEDGNYTHDEAIKKFSKKRLPKKKDFELAEKHGFREILPGFDEREWYWSASVYSNPRDSAWMFSSVYGYMSLVYRTNSPAVRCVEK